MSGEGAELLSDFTLILRGKDVLHVRDTLDELGTEVRLNVGHGQRLAASGVLIHSLLALLVELADDLHHTNSLDERAVAIVLRESVLLEELFLNDIGDLERGLLVLTERILTNELHNFDEIVLELENGLDSLLVVHEVGVY